jgi:Acetyltransferase (GNAT) domain
MANTALQQERPGSAPELAGLAEPEDRPAAGAMSVRALERADLPAVAALVRKTFQLGTPRAEPALADFLARTLIDQPWAEAEIPSLVGLDGNGRVVGFVAAEIRRMRLEGRMLRFAWAGHTAVAPTARTGALGFLLMRRLLEGPQDATFGDSASPLMEQMWLRLGGRRLELKGIHWVRVFRPAGVAARVASPRRPRLRSATRRLASAVDDGVALVARRALAPRQPAAV